MTAITLRHRTQSLAFEDRPIAYKPSLIILEDGSGYLMAEASYLRLEIDDEGESFTLPVRSSVLALENRPITLTMAARPTALTLPAL